MGVNKVIYGDDALIDLTEDTVTKDDVLSGVFFHNAAGDVEEGNLIVHEVIDNLTSTSTEDALSANQGRILNDKIREIEDAGIATRADVSLSNIDEAGVKIVEDIAKNVAPDKLSMLEGDETHRVVTDNQIHEWDNAASSVVPIFIESTNHPGYLYVSTTQLEELTNGTY